MNGILSRIEVYKRDEIAEAKRDQPLPGLLREAEAAEPTRGFRAAIQARTATGQRALIAEIKKASPSKGLIRPEFDPPELARAYAAGGATGLSVLTDAPSFQGHRTHLAAARAAGSLPVLRKDFLFDPYQVVQSRAWGADCVLIILAAVDDAVAHDLEDTALDLGMDVIVEVHDEAELERATAMRTALIGINNRDLVTFETTLATSERLAPRVPAGRTVIGESGLSGPADLERLGAVGISAFLIGESLLRQPDVEVATRDLLSRSPAAPAR